VENPARVEIKNQKFFTRAQNLTVKEDEKLAQRMMECNNKEQLQRKKYSGH